MLLFNAAFVSFLLSTFSTRVNAQANVTGNCITGRITFDRLRTYSNFHPDTTLPQLNVSTYDATVDYGANTVSFPSTGGVNLQLIKSSTGGAAAAGARLSTTRYILYAKITARMHALTLPGAVTTFITMSDRKDEIDWEMVGSSNTTAQTNVFYKGIQEFAIHGTTEKIATAGPNGANGTGTAHNYIIDWKHNTLSWGIDGTILRTLNKQTSISPLTPPGERWFPSTPSLVQISVWDGGSSPNAGTANWAGGPIPWGSQTALSALYEYIDIQCYNDNDLPVPKWPANDANPNFAVAPATQPTSNAPKPSTTGPTTQENSAKGSGYAMSFILTVSLTLGLAAFMIK
ncbi:hypothetical protein BASA50_011271 [Batrachochytrium salamandrivorans]|uniref:GH16 domain-containing protein n=1 Tax=Batrachochytrium salamandrivorans TaxID=1357716 RepID=A0ABQ8EWR1_9FUNG|nr:hypothetical protein BASA62_006336 [Batrachochytrium salamandrivorans]KAH6587667.1 hypothetical protein BASA50_011271 [Batrachochytrium salamandrivorans]KAJ1336657.1 hypothetical protein BSLG_006976 [Batrachochytrium salamandrivorans]